MKYTLNGFNEPIKIKHYKMHIYHSLSTPQEIILEEHNISKSQFSSWNVFRTHWPYLRIYATIEK